MDDTRQIVQTIQGMADKVKEDNLNPGSGDVGPGTETKDKAPAAPIAGAAGANPLVTLKMTPEEVKQWWTRIETADSRRKNREGGWDILLDEYNAPKPKKTGDPEDLKISRHFRDVHTKIGSLFYKSPDLILEPKDPGPAGNQIPNPMPQMPGMPVPPPLTMEDVISVKQAVLDMKLGPDEIDAGALIDELLFDVLAWSGIGCAKLGYRCTMVDVQQPVMGPDPNWQPPPQQTILGLGPTPQAPMVPQMDPLTGQPKMETVKVPIHEEWYWRRFSPKKLLFNDDLRSTRFDADATWIGMWFFMSPKKAMLPPAQGGLGLSEDEVKAAVGDDKVHTYTEDQTADKSSLGLVAGVELFCKASVFGGNVHPLAINQLVLVKGVEDRPVIYRPSPDQEFDELGKLTQDSMIGFPIRILAIRDLADSPFPASDSAFTNSEVKELQTWRRQSIALRQAQIGKYLFDKDAFGEEETDQLKKGTIGQYIGVEAGKLKDGPEKVLTITAQIHGTPDDYRNQELLSRDLDETLGIGANQSGAPEQTVRTATETETVQQAVNARNAKELDRVVKFYLAGVRMIDQLLMRYADTDQYVHIAGQDGARRMQVWNNQLISGRFIYTIAPDSQLRTDTARDRQALQNFYNIAAPDPLVNRRYLLSRMARMYGLDPAKILLPPSALPMMLPGMGMQPPHGGPATTSSPVNKHQQTNSGGRPNAPGADNHREGMPV